MLAFPGCDSPQVPHDQVMRRKIEFAANPGAVRTRAEYVGIDTVINDAYAWLRRPGQLTGNRFPIHYDSRWQPARGQTKAAPVDSKPSFGNKVLYVPNTGYSQPPRGDPADKMRRESFRY